MIIIFITDEIIWPNYYKWLEDLKDTFQEGREVTPEQLDGFFGSLLSMVSFPKDQEHLGFL